MACVHIPVRNSEEEVRVALDQLPRDASEILDILKAEQAPLDLWLIIAREYFKQGKLEQFRQILEEGSSPDIDEFYANVRYERIAILNALGAYYHYLGKIETKQREKEEHFTLATQYYNKASRVDIHEPSTWIGKGQLLLTKGEVEQAFAAFKIVLDGDRDNVPALLGQACVEFNHGHYSESLELYKRALQVYPDCPAAVRLGIGLCCYKLKQYGKAQRAFERVLQLDPKNVEALVALAIIDMNTNEASRIRNGMEKMQKAFEIYPSCAMAPTYLANHFFFTGQRFLVEQLTETAFAIADHGPTKSHSFYNLARSYHSKGDYEKPGLYYMASAKEANKPREFVFPCHGLGQVQLKMGDLGSALSNMEKVLKVYPNNCGTLKVLGHIYVQLGRSEKAQEALRKATKIDPRDAQSFLDLGELLISTDEDAALDAFKTASILLRKGGQEVPTEVLNNLGVLHFEREEFELAERNFKEALGDGIWLDFFDGKLRCTAIEASASVLQYKDMELFYQLEREGRSIVLPWKKVTSLFNLARLFEQLHNIEVASALYRLILFKYPDFIDAYLRLASIAKARNYVQLSIELVNDALKVDDKCSNALSMLAELELKNDDCVSAKETLRAAGEATNGKDSSATLSPSSWSDKLLSKVDSKKIGGRAGGEKLLNEIETISNALYLTKNPLRNSSSGANARQRSFGKTNLPDPKSQPKSGNEDPTRKDKKSIWSWKTLKAFSHVRNRKFNCCFSLLVQSIKGLPSDLDDFSLSVFWKRRDGLLVTRPKKVVQGKVEFEEELYCTCTVHGRGNGPHHSAKYEAKHSLLYASVYGASEVDLGKHRVDLTRFLPLTLEELEEEKSSGKWATIFKLSGKAKGATMNVSFGYTVVGDNLTASGNHIGDSLKSKQNKYGIGKSEMVFGESGGRSRIQNTKSSPGKTYNDSLVSSRPEDDIKDLHEVLPVPQLELAKSVDVLYKKFDDGEFDTSADSNPKLDVCTEYSHLMKSEDENTDVDCGTEFSFVEQGIELSSMEQGEKIDAQIEVLAEEQVERINVKVVDSSSVGRPEIDNELLMVHDEGSRVVQQKEKHDNYTEELVACNSSSNDYDIYTKESILKELESALSCVSELETVALESPEEEHNSEFMSSDEPTGECLPLDFDDEFLEDECLESDFLRMLGIEQSPFGSSSDNEPESPREQLLRQFEDEAAAGGYSLFDFDIEDDNYPACGYNFNGSSNTSFDLPSIGNANEAIDFTEDTAVWSKTKAKMLEDLETEALMHKWGLNEEVFQQSPSSSSHGFGSPSDFPCEDPFDLPPLGEGLGPFIQTKNGGFLRTMNPAIFQNAKSGGNLIMQVSSPVVVPAEMGSGIMEILQRLASVGIEKLSMQANKLMPLEDITGKTMQQVAWEACPALEGSNRQCMPQSKPVFEQDSFGRRKGSMGSSSSSRHEKFSPNSMHGESESEYVSLEDVAPLALDKIEALSIEGLRIQSGMSEDEAPSNISAQPIGEFSALRGKGIDISGSLGLEGTAGLQLLDIKDNGDDVDGLMGLSLSLDEWMRLDSGELDDEEIISEHTSKILAAHHANSLDFIRGGTKGDRRRGKSSSRKCGLLGNNFTVALMVQLRDPSRNYEPVGAPMLSLIQVERVFIPPKPKIYSTVSEIRINYDEDNLESVTRVEKKEEEQEEKDIPQFRITEVHVVGIKSEPNKKLWGSSTSSQQKSGSRWLIANGMGKSKNHPSLKTKAAAAAAASKPLAAPEPKKVQQPAGDKGKESLWSISSGAMWKAFSALNPHARNPNVIFPKEDSRLR